MPPDGDTPWICCTCCVEYPPTPAPPARCPICEDERQFVNLAGQGWTRSDLGYDAQIAAAFAPAGGSERIAKLCGHARARGLDALVEVHDEAELDRALAAGADLVGINNRDLRSFEVDLGVTERLAARVPPGVLVVAESGIFTPQEVARLEAAGAAAVLVGESLMREADLVTALRRLRRAS